MERSRRFAREWRSIGLAKRMKWRQEKGDGMVSLITAKIVEAFGENGLDVLSAAYEEKGEEDGSKIAESLNIERADLHSAVSVIEALCIIFGIDSNFKEEGGRMTLKLDACPFEYILTLYRESLCIYYVQGLVHAINPCVKVKIVKKICEGGDHCLFQFTLSSDENASDRV
ncbi:MAG TPA: hypothetical protein ENI32_00570 [Candidatus Syntrophoarchaeum butanivorans]|uniref:Metanogen output domain-containing protein n=1 Tax=Candidatus Syntropharchaeum butanivorans TaxID=1839936 RepID=A0A1F2P6R0_9EURY|nr:MAG: hypothetical protein SBU_000639 [Candidatus Syntrophoarchaeum butanivorans]RJS71110.1 MAG: hypothetical protein CW694_05925 [Candidatus Syntrophoarchaeum sp. WYZ-LMO15]HEC56374.1 hypothetical protein [Candidatus Syntrophoarchaeum butanivorans]